MKTPLCESFEQFDLLFETHLGLAFMGAPQYQDWSGCLPPCVYDDHDIQLRSFPSSGTLSNMFNGTDVTAVGITLPSTSLRVVREVPLYQLSNLVGEVGGCMGMFLGISLLTVYQLMEQLVCKIKQWFAGW